MQGYVRRGQDIVVLLDDERKISSDILGVAGKFRRVDRIE